MEAINLDNRFYNFSIFSLPKEENTSELSVTRPLLIVVEAEHYKEELKDLLKKIISAIKIDLEREAFVVIYNPQQPLGLHQYPCKAVISFGVKMKTLGIHYNVIPYQLLDYGKHQYLLVDNLSKIAENRALKAALWKELQTLGASIKN